MWQFTSNHVQHTERKEHAISPDQLIFKAVDIADHRLYAVLFEPQHAQTLSRTWGTTGLNISIRGAERLLKGIDAAVEVPYKVGDAVPKPTWTPEGPAHEQLRQRLVDVFHHGAIDPGKVKCQAKDVFLYPSGMGGIFQSKNVVQEYLPGGTSVVLGITFLDTYRILHEESPGGFKHFGLVDEKAIDDFETWLEGGVKVTCVIVEIPGNPTIESSDLKRLKQLV